MALYMDCIVVVYANHLEFYSIFLENLAMAPRWVSSHSLRLEHCVRSACFLKYCSSPTQCWSRGHSHSCTILYLIIQNASDELDVVQVFMRSDDTSSRIISVVPFLNTLEGVLPQSLLLYVVAPGSSGPTLCCVSVDIRDNVKLPSFHILRISPPNPGDDISGTPVFNLSTVIPSLGFPILHISPCIDFDDGRGVLLIGHAIGEVCLVEFEGGAVNKRLGIYDDLPSIDGLGLSITENAVSVRNSFFVLYRLTELVIDTPSASRPTIFI